MFTCLAKSEVDAGGEEVGVGVERGGDMDIVLERISEMPQLKKDLAATCFIVLPKARWQSQNRNRKARKRADREFNDRCNDHVRIEPHQFGRSAPPAREAVSTVEVSPPHMCVQSEFFQFARAARDSLEEQEDGDAV